jgi:pimeloyl-ACP methyl ester carboxylesterase
MPYADNGGVSIHYEVGGDEERTTTSGDEPVVLLADAGYGAWQWGWQYAALAGPFEVVIPTARGVGKSDRSGSDSIAQLSDDLEAVLADHRARKVHLVGAGMGGMVALQYALDHSRAETLTLLGTSPGGPGAAPIAEDVREALVVDTDDPDALRESLKPVASDELLETDELVERIVEWRQAEDAPIAAQRGHFDAMADFDVSDRLYEITIPALVMHGDEDRVMPVENGRLLGEGLPKGEFRAFPGEHLFYVERSKAVNDALVGFLDEHLE